VRIDFVALACLLVAGCASERVVLLPAPDGRPTAVVVRDARGETLLDQPFAAVKRGAGGHRAYQSSAAEVEERFGAALAAQPARPKSFTLYFAVGGDTLTPESAAELSVVKREIADRPASEVMVIGHTDSVGRLEANDALSLKRAATVRDILVAAGVPEEKIEIAGRGEREPLIKLGDEVAEAQNRRVEISVR